MGHLIFILISSFWLQFVSAELQLTYCASTNLAGGSSATYNEFMSNGLCRDTCAGQAYAVAILQGYNCWCSNNVPEDTVNLSDCATGCPGTANENCAGNGYYGYYVFGNPSSTVGSTTATTTKSTTTTPSTTQVTLITSVVASTTIIQTTQVIDQSKTTVITIANSYSIGPTTIVSIKTVGGQESNITETQYITKLLNATTDIITPSETSILDSASGSQNPSNSQTPDTPSSASSTQTPESSPSETPLPTEEAVNRSSSSSFFDDKGKVAGTFTAVGVVIVGLIATILYCCCFAGAAGRRRRGEDSDQYTDEEASMNSITHEKAMAAAAAAAAGVGGSTLAPSSSNGSADSPSVVPPTYNVATTNTPGSNTPIRRNSSGKSIFNLFSSENNGNGTNGVDRSSSKKKLVTPIIPNTEIDDGLMFPINEFDNRLNPTTMFLNNNFSNKSLNDDQDYSRKLRVANP